MARKKSNHSKAEQRSIRRIKRKQLKDKRGSLASPAKRKKTQQPICIRNTQPEDIPSIIGICQRIYTFARPWEAEELESHQRVFPEGQIVAIDQRNQRVVGMCASLVIAWDDYDPEMSWRDFTDSGMFTNHDPGGRTLYGADVMVDPRIQRMGVGKRLYAARRELVQRLGLLRIRAGARLAGYSRYAKVLTPREYVVRILQRRLHDPTLTFQIKQGFRPLAVVSGYLKNDPASLGFSALIEWLNPKVATKRHYEDQRETIARLIRDADAPPFITPPTNDDYRIAG